MYCIGAESAAVDGLAKRVHDAAEHGRAHGDVHDAAGGTDLVALLDGVDVTEQDGADLGLVQVLGQAKDALARRGAGELEQLASHGGLEAGDMRDAVSHLGDDRRLLLVYRGVDLRQLLAQRAHDHLGADLVCH